MSNQTEIAFQFPKQFRIGEEYNNEKVDTLVNDLLTLDGVKFATTSYFSMETAIDLELVTVNHDVDEEVFNVACDPVTLVGYLHFISDEVWWTDLVCSISNQTDRMAKEIVRLRKENELLKDGIKLKASRVLDVTNTADLKG